MSEAVLLRGVEGRFQGADLSASMEARSASAEAEDASVEAERLTAARRTEPGSPAQRRSRSVRLAFIYAPVNLPNDLLKAQFYVAASPNLG